MDFMAISAGPMFKLNPSISFSLNLETKEEVQRIWDKLVDGGKVLMPLQKYPFSEFYGWLNDRYGVSWQLIVVGEEAKTRPMVTPAIMFTQDKAGKAEEAMNLYTSLFPNSKIDGIFRYEASEGPDKEGTIAHAVFHLAGQEFMALDSAAPHAFVFNEAVSFIVNCETQEEVDKYWDALSAVPEAEQCGWLKDKYGVSWQIVPTAMNKMMGSGDVAASNRVTQAFLKMKKFDIAKLEEAFKGE
jgi:predicted 3-demethylubiquinone-9 3-methyltransferase (glyoxalase superfamily)